MGKADQVDLIQFVEPIMICPLKLTGFCFTLIGLAARGVLSSDNLSQLLPTVNPAYKSTTIFLVLSIKSIPPYRPKSTVRLISSSNVSEFDFHFM